MQVKTVDYMSKVVRADSIIQRIGKHKEKSGNGYGDNVCGYAWHSLRCGAERGRDGRFVGITLIKSEKDQHQQFLQKWY